MAMPQLIIQEFELTVPSAQETIKFRPFLVKEEKILYLGLEEGSEKSINNAVMQIVNNCTFGKVGTPETPIFDLEYCFLKIRSKSVGENIELDLLCTDDNETRVDYKLNLDDVEVQLSVGHETEFEIAENFILHMRYPVVSDTLVENEDEVETDRIFRMIGDCISGITQGNDFYNRIDMSDDEIANFVDTLNTEQVEKIQKFFETMPKMRHVVEVTNPVTKKKCEILLEGLGDFFI